MIIFHKRASLQRCPMCSLARSVRLSDTRDVVHVVAQLVPLALPTLFLQQTP